LQILLEPWAERYEVPPGQEVEITGEFGIGLNQLKIEYGSHNFMAIWVPPSSAVKLKGRPLAPLTDD
jgi:hypothetical protein